MLALHQQTIILMSHLHSICISPDQNIPKLIQEKKQNGRAVCIATWTQKSSQTDAGIWDAKPTQSDY